MTTFISQLEINFALFRNSLGPGFFELLQTPTLTQEPNRAVLQGGATELRGDNFEYADGKLKDGIIESFISKSNGSTVISMSDFSLPVTLIKNFQTDPDLALQFLFSGNDTILTSDGNDFLTGFEGADVMIGKGGNDQYEVDDTGDKVVEANGQGTDKVFASVDFRLKNSQFVEKIKLTGSDDIDATGNNSANSLAGNDEDNILTGKGGADFLAGGRGGDRFRFDTDLQVDRIKDYGAGDRIQLDQDLFDVLRAGKLAASAFKDLDAPGARVDAGDRILYDSGTGTLKYDVNGSDPGGRTVFAKLVNKADIDAGDFLVIA